MTQSRLSICSLCVLCALCGEFLGLGPQAFCLAAGSYEEKLERSDAPFSDSAAAVKEMPLGEGFRASLGGSLQHRGQSFDNLVSYLAADETAPASNPLTLPSPPRGEGRVRGDRDFSLFTRERLNLDIHHDFGFRCFLEAQDAREFASGRNPSPASTRNPLDLYQAFLELGLLQDIADQPSLQIRVGRQELELGKGHFFSAQDWNNTGQNFDLARADWRPDGFELTAFAGWPLTADSDRLDSLGGAAIAGANLKAVGIPRGHTVEGRLLYSWDEKTDFSGENGSRGPRRLWTLGALATGPFLDAWDYTLDGAYQTGTHGGNNVRAWSFYGELGWTYRFSWRSLRLAAQYSQSSGDRNPTDGTIQTFDPQFADQYLFHGRLFIVGNRNLDDLNPKAQARLWRGGLVQVDYHLFRLNQARDALYQPYEDTVRQDPAGRAGRRAGQELDLQIFHTFHQNLSVSGGVFLFKPGELFRKSEGPRVSTARSFFIVVKTGF